ncbi:MAG: sugar nucleotide-binding protein [Renibacterium salmoninarum]|nr:sugar nucleotide-binding protein [Renibacterium salmoninarum]
MARHLRALGHDVVAVGGRKPFEPGGPAVDVLDLAGLKSFLQSHEDADVIVNCVGTLVSASDRDPDLAVYTNAYFPHLLERFGRDSATKIIHLSTDCVFEGTNPPYLETSAYDGQSVYDRSKALGEIRNEKDLTFRMSIVGPDLSPSGVGLFNWFMQQQGSIRGFTKAIWNGITTVELARGVAAAIEQDLVGLYHLVPDGPAVSKYELLKLFQVAFDRSDLQIEADDRSAPNKTLVNSRDDFDFQVKPYTEQLSDMRLWIDSDAGNYSHYRM